MCLKPEGIIAEGEEFALASNIPFKSVADFGLSDSPFQGTKFLSTGFVISYEL
jgi:hypothetical protein